MSRQKSQLGRTYHLLLSVRGATWREVYLAMFTLYQDDSGTAPDQPVAVAAAIVIPALQISRLEREWNAFKDKEGFSAFHMSEFVWRNKESEFADWDDIKRERVFARIRQICRKYGVRAESCVANKKDYDEVVPVNLRRILGNNHYTFAVRNLGDDLDNWRRSEPIKPPLQFVFSWEEPGSEKRNEIETAMQQAEFFAEKQGRKGDFEHWAFERMEGMPGLQCADVIAWCSYRYALLEFTGKPVHEFAKIGLDDFTRDHWLRIRFSSRQMMEKWTAGQQASSNVERAFAMWEERCPVTAPQS